MDGQTWPGLGRIHFRLSGFTAPPTPPQWQPISTSSVFFPLHPSAFVLKFRQSNTPSSSRCLILFRDNGSGPNRTLHVHPSRSAALPLNTLPESHITVDPFEAKNGDVFACYAVELVKQSSPPILSNLSFTSFTRRGFNSCATPQYPVVLLDNFLPATSF